MEVARGASRIDVLQLANIVEAPGTKEGHLKAYLHQQLQGHNS